MMRARRTLGLVVRRATFIIAGAAATTAANCEEAQRQHSTAFSSIDDAHSKWDYDWDKRNEEFIKENVKRGVHRIILVRHGQYEVCEDDHDCKLTKLGRKQAQITGRRLKELLTSGSFYPLSDIFFSTMVG